MWFAVAVFWLRCWLLSGNLRSSNGFFTGRLVISQAAEDQAEEFVKALEEENKAEVKAEAKARRASN
jgi:hypothetical protein